MTTAQLRKLNEALSGHTPLSLLRWVKENIEADIAMTTSFQISGVVIMHMLHRLEMMIPVFFIDTGYHFPETLDFKERIIRLFDLKVRVVKPDIAKEVLEEKHGKYLYQVNPTVFCKINKTDPLNTVKKEVHHKFWISGLRRDQGGVREKFNLLMRDARKHIRIHPLINWTRREVWKYTLDNNIPYHPLYDKGYSSIGCFPPSCTAKNDAENGERSGRWEGHSKTECGLHLDLE